MDAGSIIPAVDIGTLLKDIPAGAWVAISADGGEVVARGADVGLVLADAKQQGHEHPIVLRVPDSTGALIL